MLRLRSILSLGLWDRLDDGLGSIRSEAAERGTSVEQRLAKIENDIALLRSLVRKRDDRATEKLKAGLSSLVNFMSILPQLKVTGVIPPFPHQGFEITGESATFLYYLIRRHRPRLVLELGSGSSTWLIAASLRANGIGRVVSIEHDDSHVARTAQLLEQSDLSDWAHLLRAPLIERTVGDRKFQWYDVDAFLKTLPEKIDLLFIDGPPGKMQSLSRFPAMPVLAPHLAHDALIFVDDGGREDETRMVELWRELDDVAFASESLSFLPKAPVLLTLARSAGRVAEFPVAREERAEVPPADELFGQGRRSGT
jgi:hypothetical protein